MAKGARGTSAAGVMYQALEDLATVIGNVGAWGGFEYGTQPCTRCGEQSDVLTWHVGDRYAGLCPNCGQAFTD